jgi:16S rRNA (cytosine967-C5)-methyltransferase
LLDALRFAAQALSQTLAGRNLDQVLQALVARQAALTAQQRAAIQDLSFGVLRHYGHYTALLDQLLQKPLTDEAVKCLLLAALHQLESRKTAQHTVVDQAVRAALAMDKAWAKGLVNAVLRNFLRRREGLLLGVEQAGEVARYSHPQWWIDKLRMQYPDDWQSILAANNRHPPMTLRVNRRRCEVSAYLALLRQHDMDADLVGEAALRLRQPVAVAKLPGFADGLVSVQDAGAQLAAPWLDVANGMRVLDACAAPGGKSAHLLEWADVRLTSLDHDPARLEKVGDNLRRLGLQADCRCGDAATPEGWWDGQPFQRILADVPCSASGVVRRHPDIKWLRRPADIMAFAGQQERILGILWRLLAPGGKLLYVTCSIFSEENQQQINSFLSTHSDARHLPLPEHPDVKMNQGQLIPDDRHDGFFYALLEKI